MYMVASRVSPRHAGMLTWPSITPSKQTVGSVFSRDIRLNKLCRQTKADVHSDASNVRSKLDYKLL